MNKEIKKVLSELNGLTILSKELKSLIVFKRYFKTKRSKKLTVELNKKYINTFKKALVEFEKIICLEGYKKSVSTADYTWLSECIWDGITAYNRETADEDFSEKQEQVYFDWFYNKTNRHTFLSDMFNVTSEHLEKQNNKETTSKISNSNVDYMFGEIEPIVTNLIDKYISKRTTDVLNYKIWE